MNIFKKITLQSMKKSRTRTIVTIIGVILSAIMITAVATFGVSLQNYMINGAIQKYGDWHVEFLDVDSSFVQERTLDEGVETITTLENIGYATLDGGKNPNKPYLFITGFSKDAFDSIPIKLTSGRLPADSGEILVPAHVLANGGVKFSVGDTLSLTVGNRMSKSKNLGQHDPYTTGEDSEKNGEILVSNTEKLYTVVGICERPAFEEFSAPGYTLITTDTSDEAENFNAFVTLTKPRQIYTYAKSIAEEKSYIFNDNVLRFMGLSDDTTFNTLLYSIGAVLLVLIMIGSIFLIYNSFNISLNERTRQFGILSSVGATAKQLRNSVLFEGFCIGAIGIPIGILVGIGSIGLVISFVAENFGTFAYSGVPLVLTVSIPMIVLVAIVSMITILISAYIPALKAANTPVMENIRQTNEVKINSKTMETPKIVERIYGLEGTLALKNFKRNKKAYRSIVLSLTLSVVLFVSGNVFSTSLKQAAQSAVMDTDYDISFTTQDMDEAELSQLYDTLQTATGVYESSYQAISLYWTTVKTNDFSDSYRDSMSTDLPAETVDLELDIQFIEDSIYLDFIESLNLPIDEYIGGNTKMIAVSKARDKNNANQEGLSNMFTSPIMNFRVFPEKNDTPETKQEQDVNITFVDTIPIDVLPRTPSEVKPYVFMVVAPYSMKENFNTSDVNTDEGLTFLSENPAQSIAQMETMIQGMGITSEYTLYNIHKIFEESRSMLFVVNVFTYVFVIMISLIATANVFNTISTNIKLRRRELAMLRSVGMADRSFKKMMNFECFFYGMRTLLFGVPIAGIVSWLIYKGLALGGADITYSFPWGSIAISMFGVFCVVFITMLYATNKIKKENIIDALRDDMT